MTIEADTRTGKEKVSGEFHGYRAELKDWFLSLPKIEEKAVNRPKWAEIVKANGLPDYFLKDGKCDKIQFTSALKRYLTENTVEYDEPDLSATQALGLESNVIASLPTVHLLRAITDYRDEIDKRSSTTTFPDCNSEGMAHKRQFIVDSTGCRAFSSSLELIIRNHSGCDIKKRSIFEGLQ